MDRLVRAVTKPYPGAFVERDGEKIIIWEGTNIVSEETNKHALKIKLKNGFYFATVFESVKS